MRKLSKKRLILLFTGFVLLSSVNVYASNFVCGQDLDGNGDITGVGETSSCTTIGTEQFCQIGALTCTTSNNVDYTCPVAGNSCVDVSGVQKCSINKCVDLDKTPPIETVVPSTSTIDDGQRNADGACMEQALIFSGRNLSCKYSGLAKNCCKNTGVVFTDSTGSYATTMVTSVAMSASWEVLKAGYEGFTRAYAFFGDVEMASFGAEVAAQDAINGFQIDPTTIAISIAIHVITEFISCGQQDTETAMLNGSGYCHLVGSYCSKEWSLVGCVQKSKGYCCFNSKLGRILQEQGREQMGVGWGSAENPSCGGFTPDQFQALDFSRIDMSEYYGDIKSKGSSLIQKNITDSIESYYKQIKR
jgi:conjugal transfer mating pair stabilization protein TraN